MAIYVYMISDGSLYSWSPNDDDPVADDDTLAAQGMDKVSGLPPLDESHIWDAATTTVVTITPPPPPKPIATSTWIMRFTPQEFETIRASTDATVVQFWYAVNHTSELDLSDSMITDGVAAMVSAGLLTQSRADEILAGV